MKLPNPIHSWNVTPRQAIVIQRHWASKVAVTKLRGPVRFVAGLDATFTRDEKWCVAAVVLWDACDRVVAEQYVARRRLLFPYVPGLLSFREAPALLAALRKLKTRPDVLMCDGQGLAHPRRFGLACHVGLLTGISSIGCAKSLLVGEHGELKPARGSKVPLIDRGERVGTVLRTRDGVNPVFVSVGHKINLPDAERIVLECGAGYRLPEPTRLADQLSKKGKGTEIRGQRSEGSDQRTITSASIAVQVRGKGIGFQLLQNGFQLHSNTLQGRTEIVPRRSSGLLFHLVQFCDE